MLTWCILCADLFLLSWVYRVSFSGCVCQYYFVLSLILRFSTRWRLVVSTSFMISWWAVIWGQGKFSFSLESCFVWHWPFHFFYRDYREFWSNSFVTRRRTKIFVAMRRFGWTSFDEVWESENQVATGLEVEKTVRHDFWIFDVSFTKIKRIKITTTLITNTILIYGIWGWLNL